MERRAVSLRSEGWWCTVVSACCVIGFGSCAMKIVRHTPTATHDCATLNSTLSLVGTRRSMRLTHSCAVRLPTDRCYTPTTAPNCVTSESSPRPSPAIGNTARRHASCLHVATVLCCDLYRFKALSCDLYCVLLIPYATASSLKLP